MADMVDFVFFAALLFGILSLGISKKLDELPFLMLSGTVLVLATIIEALKFLNIKLGWVGAIFLFFTAFASFILFAALAGILVYRTLSSGK